MTGWVVEHNPNELQLPFHYYYHPDGDTYVFHEFIVN